MDFYQIDFEKILFPSMDGWLLAAKIFFILFDLGVIAFMVYVWVTTIYLRRLFIIDLVEFFTFRAYGTRIIDSDWIAIKKKLVSKNAGNMRQAVLDAGRLVDDVLQRLAFEGRDLGEKLEKPRAEVFSDLEAMKDAEILCKRLNSVPRPVLEYSQAKAAIMAFEQGLKDVSAFRDK